MKGGCIEIWNHCFALNLFQMVLFDADMYVNFQSPYYVLGGKLS